jgi:hypothetical protein
MLFNSLGMVVDENQKSDKDKLLRKKYIGVWRLQEKNLKESRQKCK